MKIIIADDERLVRVSLRSMLAELDFPVEIIAEASNGEELAALAGQLLPDAALVDVQMPKLNGLAGIKAATAVSPRTQWIVLTGFSEFAYAQEAIRLRAVNYLLKPVSPDQLREALEPIARRQRELELASNKEFECDVTAAVHGLSRPDGEEERFFSGKAHYETVIFTVDSPLDEKQTAALQLEFRRKLREVANDMTAGEIRLALFILPDGDLGTVCVWDDQPGFNGPRMKDHYFSLIEQLRVRLNRQEFSITAFHSDEGGTLSKCLAELLGFSPLKPLRAAAGIGCRHRWRDIQLLGSDNNLLMISRLLIKMANSYRDGNFYGYVNSIRTLQKYETATASAFVRYKDSWQRFIRSAVGLELPDREADWYKKLEAYGECILKRQVERRQAETDLVERVLVYVDQNYRFDIGIGQIAEKLNVTPNYLSTLVHKKTGKLFMKYLTEVRMTKAKELLADPGLQIQDVAEEVGYYSAKHFTKLFTQYFGCYPSEYRKGLKM